MKELNREETKIDDKINAQNKKSEKKNNSKLTVVDILNSESESNDEEYDL